MLLASLACLRACLRSSGYSPLLTHGLPLHAHCAVTTLSLQAVCAPSVTGLLGLYPYLSESKGVWRCHYMDVAITISHHGSLYNQ